ncbi:MAG: nucleotidyltransferase family protein [Clostridia bacterium]|nr:nucleotidyltransferase family protein [Clostridia bacterium]
MKICATVAEFNPFHNGHNYLINSQRGSFDAVIAVMSGNFVQRGAPAVYDKFSRSRAAVMNGCDLVIELPIIYSLAPAEFFALGAVRLLNACGVVDSLFFGSECGEIEPLRKIAELSDCEDEKFKASLKEKLAKGLPYPKAKALCMEERGADGEILSKPNNILAIEYLRALSKTNSSITPLTSKRYGAEHDSNIASNSIASASHIRTLIEKGSFTQNFMPPFPYPAPVFEKHFNDIIVYALRRASREDFEHIGDCSPALASRFMSARGETDCESIIRSVKSKNFTEGRIRRVLWNLILNNPFDFASQPEYIRILAQNERGSAVLSEMKFTASLPVVLKGSELKDNAIFNLEAKSTDIYNIVRKIPSGADFRHSPVVIKNFSAKSF